MRTPRHSLNEGRGLNPGYTDLYENDLAFGTKPLNEGRGLNPGYTRFHHSESEYDGSALNEGRGLNPGYTRRPNQLSRRTIHAQRRPGPEPRLHIGAGRMGTRMKTRSTKAGA